MTLRRFAIQAVCASLLVTSVVATAAQQRFAGYDQWVVERRTLILRLKETVPVVSRDDDPSPATPPADGVVDVVAATGRRKERRYYQQGEMRAREILDEGGRLFRLDVVEGGRDRIHVMYDLAGRETGRCFFDAAGAHIDCVIPGRVLPLPIVMPPFYS